MKSHAPAAILLCCWMLGGCSVWPTTARFSGSASSPEQVLEDMRQLELKADFPAFGRCLTQRGKGWLIGEICQSLLWEAYEEGHDETLGHEAGDLLDKYGLSHLAGEFPEWATQIGRGRAWERLARRVGNRWGEFLRDYRTLHPVLIFPAHFQVVSRTDKPAVLTLVDPNHPELSLKIRFVKQTGKWRCDGEEFQ